MQATLQRWAIVVAAALLGGLLAVSAHAGPTIGGFEAGVHRAGTAEQIAYRRCWWHNGRRHCRWYEGRSHPSYRRRDDSDYYEHNADKLPHGTQRWWDQMLRENRAGNPGGGRD